MLRIWPRRAKCDRRHVLLWWGSFYAREHLTIGDAHAVENVSERLAAAGFEHCILSRANWPFASAPVVRHATELRDDLESLIFVCGPLNEAPPLRRLLDRYPRARKIAVGVSVLANQGDFMRRFDAILARDGTADAAFDLAPARFTGRETSPAPTGDAPIALCFVGKQGEYGAARSSLHVQAEDLLTRSVRRTGAPSLRLSTVLSGAPDGGQGILQGFKGARVIATTRLHGSLYGLLHSRPVVALDQIPGGAKVADVLGRVGWPLVFRADQADQTVVDAALETARSGAVQDDVERIRGELIDRSEAALSQAVALITGDKT